MMKLIDFDTHFTSYAHAWCEAHRDEFTPDQMELMIPDIYADWLKTPASWLDGQAPDTYFKQFADVKDLVLLLLCYHDSDMGTPDPLMERITELGKEAQSCMMDALRGKNGLVAQKDPAGARIMVMRLLIEMQCTEPMDDYIRLIARRDEEDDVADVAAESLDAMGDIVIDKILAAMEKPTTREGRETFAGILSNFHGDPRIFGWLIKLFEESDNKGLMAAYLGKFGNDEALPVLEAAIQRQDIDYQAYLMIRDAIEELGGIVEVERDFSGDATYEILRQGEGE